MPPVGDPVQRRQRTRKRVKPAPSSVFGPLHRADAPITRAQKLAGQRVQRARRPVLQRTNVPYVPKLAHPTPKQRTAATQIVGTGLKRQGVTGEDVRALARGGGGRAKQQAVNRYLGRQRTTQRNIDVSVAQARLPRPKAAPAPFTFNDALYRGAVVHPRLLPGQQGKLATLGRSLAAQRVAQLLPGAAPPKLHLGPLTATVNYPGLKNALISATHLDYGDAPTKIVRNAIGDLGTFGTAPELGGYQIGRGVLEAGWSGDTSRLRKIASGVGAGIAQEVTHPGQYAQQHPLLAALDLSGVGAVVGRTAGALARIATAGELGATARAPLALVDDAGSQVLHERTFSKDLIRKQFQEAADSRREQATDVNGRPMFTQTRGKTVPVMRASEGESARYLRRRGNFAAAAANSGERLAREVAQRDGRVKGIRGRRAQDLVAMVAEGTVTSAKHFKQDLEAHATRLEREHRVRTQGEPGYRHSAEEQAALNRIGTVRAALSDPKVMGQAGKIVAAGIQHGGRLFSNDRALMAREILSEESGTRSPLIVPAIEHMGGRHFTVEEHRALERDALVKERAAAEAVKAASPAERSSAVAAYHAARNERIAVSGRHPERVKAHEESRQRVARAEQQVRAARAEQLQADRAVARMGGAQSVQRGQMAAERMQVAARGGRRAQNVLAHIDRQLADEPRLMRGAGKERRMARQRDVALKRAQRAKVSRQRAEKALRQERHQLRVNPMPEIRAGVRTAEGKHLSNRDIENFLRSRGRDPQTVAYLPHVLPRDMERFSRSAHHSRFDGSRPDLDSGPTRTGEAYRKGATESSAELLQSQGVRQAVLLSKAEHIDGFVTQHGLKHPAWAKAQRGEQLSRHEQRVVDRGGAFTPKEAQELADRVATDTRSGHLVMTTKGGQQFVPYRTYSGRLDAETQRVIRENLQGPGAMESLPQRLLNDRVLTTEDFTGRQTRNIVLVPKALDDQLVRHLRPAGELEKMLQLLNRPFRMAVLPQPRWLTGNFVEPYLVRLPTVGSGLVNIPGLALDIAAAAKAVRRMERSGDPRLEALAKQVRAQHFGGLFIGGRGSSNRRTRDEFETYGRLVAKFPAVEQMGDLGATVLKYGLKPLDAFFKVNRAAIEGPAQRAAFGRQVRRDIQEFTGNWFDTIRLGQKAIDEVNRGLLNTHTQERFMRMQHELLGQYEGYGPRTRALIQGPMPFLPWALSAARFVYWTMPVHRTAQTALLIKTQDAMSKAWADEHADTPPGSLRLDPRNKQGGYVPMSRYTPYGLTGPIVEGDTQGITDTVLPQISGLAAALSGNDPFGKALKVPPSAGNPTGKPSGGQKLGIAAYGLAEAMLPYLATVRRLREHGETPYAGSTVLSPSTKPGTSHGESALERTFYPFRATYLRAGGEKVIPPKRPARSRHSNSDLDLMRKAVHGPAAGAISSDDLDLIRRASRGG